MNSPADGELGYQGVGCAGFGTIVDWNVGVEEKDDYAAIVDHSPILIPEWCQEKHGCSQRGYTRGRWMPQY